VFEIASRVALTFGREHLLIYNDAFIPLLGDKRPRRTLGRRANECSPEIWHIVGPILESLLQQRWRSGRTICKWI
jgi:hypothetical protein